LIKPLAISSLSILCFACSKTKVPPTPEQPPTAIYLQAVEANSQTLADNQFSVAIQPAITVRFTQKVASGTLGSSVKLKTASGTAIAISTQLTNGDSTILIRPTAALSYLTKYNLTVGTTLQSAAGANLSTTVSRNFTTVLDSSRKFPAITEEALLDLAQRQTFKYFWDFGHPVSGLARERNSSGDVVTSGGSGFGVMAIVTAISRGFITRAQGLARLRTMTTFLKNNAQTVHGAFPHWLNGATGAIVPFSTKDNGADLVETSYLMMGLLTARQYFDQATADEIALRADINTLYNNVEWDWFRRGGQNVLYWHYSSNYEWDMNMPIRGWNECLITYVMAAASTTHGIPASVYSNGWAANGNNGFTNGQTYFGIGLPFGTAYGGPLFFSHYSFMGINPNGLTDTYGNYQTQVQNHVRINQQHCINNPLQYFGYSDSCWGLTASDIQGGYTASSPTNDVGVIAPTAALSSMPFQPAASLKALKFFYYVLGDKIWKEYGFVDAFSLHQPWYADSFLAIDQGPIIVMIENYRTGLIWNLFTGCPEVKAGMRNLGFSAPYL
jgi:hypothetical protein